MTDTFLEWLRPPKSLEKHFHRDIGFPERFDIAPYIRNLPETLVGSTHYRERSEEKGLPYSLPKHWIQASELISITRYDKQLLRYSVRGPYGWLDLTVAIDAGTGCLITGWFNAKDDWHQLTHTNYENPLYAEE